MKHLCIEESHPFWVALSIGNTHWRWGYFEGTSLIRHWKTKPQTIQSQSTKLDWQQYCELSPAFAWHQHCDRTSFPFLYLASVVEAQTLPWLDYPRLQALTLNDIPMEGLYPTLGIDRALAVLGAGSQYGWPILVIDAGTAMTFSGAEEKRFVGGAISPGLGLQLKVLSNKTAALPSVKSPSSLPPRWATNTSESILSGVIHSMLDSIVAYCRQWQYQFPHSHAVLTGGDGKQLLSLLKDKLQQESPQIVLEEFHYDEHLIFKGMSRYIFSAQKTVDKS